jgi:hypothetical protein
VCVCVCVLCVVGVLRVVSAVCCAWGLRVVMDVCLCVCALWVFCVLCLQCVVTHNFDCNLLMR